MLVKTRAIVLRVTKYGDAQQIVDMITFSHGRLSFVLTLSRSSRAKIKRQYFQPLTILDLEFDFRPKVQLLRLKDAAIAIPFSSIPFSPLKLCLSAFLAEFICFSTRNEVENEHLFQFLVYSVLWLDKAKGNYANFHIVFMLQLTLFLGFSPNMDEQDGKFFDMQAGNFVSQVPTHSHFLNECDSRMMRILMRLNYDTMHVFGMTRNDRNRCALYIIRYYQLHIPNFPDLKSLEVLRDLLD